MSLLAKSIWLLPANHYLLPLKKSIFLVLFCGGPPGVGKTTLARIYAHALDAQYYELSAVSAGKEDIKKIIEGPLASPKTKTTRALASSESESQGTVWQSAPTETPKKPKILFLDEIHRFNKAQQDFLLPYVESGKLTLIGATTENPSFEVISALLSRCRVFVLKELSEQDMAALITRTGFDITDDAKEWLIALANGDARQALSALETTTQLYKKITLENLQNAVQNSTLRYDKKAEEHYNTISAFIKSMRASQPDAALYYLARMVESGEDPKFIARRMVVFASEDIGLADPQALRIANDVFRAVEIIGYPECAINLGHGVCYLARAPKNRDSYNAYFSAVDEVKKTGNLPIPMSIRNAPTQLMKDLGYHKGYQLYTQEDLLPEKLKGKKYLRQKT